jgi:hypothetical protein
MFGGDCSEAAAPNLEGFETHEPTLNGTASQVFQSTSYSLLNDQQWIIYKKLTNGHKWSIHINPSFDLLTGYEIIGYRYPTDEEWDILKHFILKSDLLDRYALSARAECLSDGAYSA